MNEIPLGIICFSTTIRQRLTIIEVVLHMHKAEDLVGAKSLR